MQFTVSHLGYWTQSGNIVQCYWHTSINISASASYFAFNINLPVALSGTCGAGGNGGAGGVFASYWQLGGSACANANTQSFPWTGFTQSTQGTSYAYVGLRTDDAVNQPINGFEVFVNL